MEKKDFIANFSKRLNSALQEKGYVSNRPKAGIDINQLAKIAGVSYQMARRYTLGTALPEMHTILKIAEALTISTSWLLFGEYPMISTTQKNTSIIEIEPTLLKIILQKSSPLLTKTNELEKMINYIVDIIYDISHINADNKTIMKIIEMTLSSVMTFSNLNKKTRA